jgi:hypothetical protein
MRCASATDTVLVSMITRRSRHLIWIAIYHESRNAPSAAQPQLNEVVPQFDLLTGLVSDPLPVASLPGCPPS